MLEEKEIDGFWNHSAEFNEIKGFWTSHSLESNGAPYSTLFNEKTLPVTADPLHLA